MGNIVHGRNWNYVTSTCWRKHSRSRSTSVKRVGGQKVMVGGLQLGRELSFTIRNVKPASGSEDQSMTRRLQMMHTSRNSHDLSSMLASDKDRLENVLVCICNEAILKSAFYDFLSERFAENLLSFRDEVDTLKALAFKIKSDHFNKSNEDRRGSRLLWRSNVPEDPKVTILAAKIFSKYIGPGAPKLICVDRLTQQAITDALKVNRAGRVNEKNASILADVFDEANNKVFQQLIYDHLAISFSATTTKMQTSRCNLWHLMKSMGKTVTKCFTQLLPTLYVRTISRNICSTFLKCWTAQIAFLAQNSWSAYMRCLTFALPLIQSTLQSAVYSL